MSDLFAKLMTEGQHQKEQVEAAKDTRKLTRKSTHLRDIPRDTARKKPRGTSHGTSLDLPTRDEIQEFSFRLRDQLKVKVQAEVPHEWQDELEDIARQLRVKRLELYRFILGEFLGKVVRRKPNPP